MGHKAALEFAEKSDTGLLRSQNEDSVAVSPAFGFAVLADGMGGYSAGEVASSTATAVLKESLEQGLATLPRQFAFRLHRASLLRQLLVEAIHRANIAILDAARAEPAYAGMGTTLVVALFHRDTVTIAHVGDSRAYRFRHGELQQLTRDHSLLQEQIDAGLLTQEAARFSENRNLVTRAVGIETEMEVEIHDHAIEPGDIYLLCSDGLSDMLEPEEISCLITPCSSLPQVCEALVQKANDNGGRDNVSVVLIGIQAAGKREGLFSRIRKWMG